MNVQVAILQKRSINEQIDKNIETIIMAMEEYWKTMQIFYCCQNVLLHGYDLPMSYEKALQIMI